MIVPGDPDANKWFLWVSQSQMLTITTQGNLSNRKFRKRTDFRLLKACWSSGRRGCPLEPEAPSPPPCLPQGSHLLWAPGAAQGVPGRSARSQGTEARRKPGHGCADAVEGGVPTLGHLVSNLVSAQDHRLKSRLSWCPSQRDVPLRGAVTAHLVGSTPAVGLPSAVSGCWSLVEASTPAREHSAVGSTH